MIGRIMEPSTGAAKQTAKLLALGALFLIPFTPLIVTNGYFFPFITGKAFYFRILVEILVVAWAVLALLDKQYRPRFSLIGAVVVGFVVWMFVADLFALNVAKAFWSNFERMEGWVLLIHLLGFFFATGAVLRVGKKWRAWFLSSLGASLLVSVYALLQLAGVLAIHQGSTRIDASFGNSAYLAVYFLFSTFIALWLALTEVRPWLKWSLFAVAVLEGVLIFFTETRGTVLGLVGALMLAALLTGLTASKQVRRMALAGLALLVILSGTFYLARNSSFVQDNHVLQRIASISLADGQVRFTIWHMAFEGVLERPIVGWGQEGFNYVFDKFYDPSLYAQEPWFDRAHNTFIDWLTAGGVPAFLLYISLFGSALWLLWRSSELSRAERIVLTAALVGYACHNFFVFDNLYSYVYFFAILALIDSQVSRPIDFFERIPEISTTDGMTYVLPVAGIVAIGLIWYVNITGMRAASELITAITPSSAGYSQNVTTFKDLLTHPGPGLQEIREQLVSFAGTVTQDPTATDADKQAITSLAISEMQKQVAAYPLDAREQLQLAYAYRSAGDEPDALKQTQIAQTLSPQKEEIFVELGVLEWDLGDTKSAQADFDQAYALGPEFPDLAAYAAAGDMSVGDQAAGDKILLATYGTTTVDNDVLEVAYYRTKNWPRLISLWQLRTTAPGADAQTWFGLAAAYYTAGDKADAIATIKKAIVLFPDAASSGTQAIQEINAGTVGQ
jgi:O-antigen ligase/tetratricopeptide (TPR) repeat protein